MLAVRGSQIVPNYRLTGAAGELPRQPFVAQKDFAKHLFTMSIRQEASGSRRDPGNHDGQRVNAGTPASFFSGEVNMGRIAKSLSAILAGSIIAATPALADVKAGVDAWSRGDYATAVRNWQAPAGQGDSDAMFNLGQAYKLGRGVPQDLKKAEDLFGQAAALGHIQASDNYGLLLFQRGERAKALPYITAASDRGDPRAQYLLGIAHFNGDGVTKDWVRAYALATMARQAGLAQAVPAIAQMDQYIPLEQRQQGAALATELAEQAQATRARQLAAVDLGSEAPAGASPPPASAIRPPRPAVPAAPAGQARPPIPAARDAVATAARVAGNDGPQTAGADFARPAVAARPAAAAPQPPAPQPPAQRPAASPASAAVPAATGSWRVQLGAFGVAGNADALWNRVKGRAELAGKGKLLVPAGRVTKLQAGGFASQAEAQAACSRLEAGGFACLATRN